MEIIVLLFVPISLFVAAFLGEKETAANVKESQKEQKVITLRETHTKIKELPRESINETSLPERALQVPMTIAKLQESAERPPFRYKVDIIEGTVNHYVSVEVIPKEGKSVVEIRQRVEKLSLMSEFVKVKAYFSTKPEIYEEFSIPPVDYRNNIAIIRLPIHKGYELYKIQYFVRGTFKEPEILQVLSNNPPIGHSSRKQGGN